MFELDRENCPMRADNGNCLPVGGFCTAVSDVCCKIAHRSYGHGYLDNTLSRQPRLLTFEEVKDHYFVPVSKLQIERYNDYAEDIKPLYFEFPNCDGWEVHWRGYDKVFAYLREWEKDYGRTWRCWTDKPTDDQRMNTPWEERSIKPDCPYVTDGKCIGKNACDLEERCVFKKDGEHEC